MSRSGSSSAFLIQMKLMRALPLISSVCSSLSALLKPMRVSSDPHHTHTRSRQLSEGRIETHGMFQTQQPHWNATPYAECSLCLRLRALTQLWMWSSRLTFKQLLGQNFTSVLLCQILYYIILCRIDFSSVHESVKWTSLIFFLICFVEGFAHISCGLQTLQCRWVYGSGPAGPWSQNGSAAERGTTGWRLQLHWERPGAAGSDWGGGQVSQYTHTHTHMHTRMLMQCWGGDIS